MADVAAVAAAATTAAAIDINRVKQQTKPKRKNRFKIERVWKREKKSKVHLAIRQRRWRRRWRR